MGRRPYRRRLAVLSVFLLVFALNWWGTYERVSTGHGAYFGHEEFAAAESFFRFCTIFTAVIFLVTAFVSIVRKTEHVPPLKK